MIIARFEFTAESAADFSETGSVFVEQMLDSTDEVIEFCEEFGDSLVDCTVNVNGKIISLMHGVS